MAEFEHRAEGLGLMEGVRGQPAILRTDSLLGHKSCLAERKPVSPIPLCIPHSLLVVIVLRDDLDPVSHQVHTVEADTELADEVYVTTLLHLLQEGCVHQERREANKSGGSPVADHI